MRDTVRRALFVAFTASICGTAGMGLSACLEDYTVLPPDAGGGPAGFDSSMPPGQEAGPTPDAGADVGSDADAAMPRTHCDDVVAPVGAAQFLCADFDSPLLSKGWDKVERTDGGTAEKTQQVATSPPNALVTTTTGFAYATLTWEAKAAKAFSEATALFQINPTQLAGVMPAASGVVELVHITTSNGSVTFGYSRGSSTIEPTGAQYYGYYVSNAAFGGAAAIQYYPITTVQLPTTTWTEVKITWEAGGKLNVYYNNINVLGVGGFGSMDTNVSFRLGAYASGDTGPVMPAHRFDDVVLSVRR
jgi:hypothetical protein